MARNNTLAPQKGKQELAMNTTPDVMFYGGAAGSGKSRLLLTKAAYYAYNDPDFSGVMFRRNTGPLKAAGGLFTEAKKLFSIFKPGIRENAMEIDFSKNGNGGSLKFTHLEHENDAEGNHQGLQYSFIGFDELTHFSSTQFLYLLGRMRSESETDSFVLGTTNPDPDSWVLNWVEWYLDDKGFPDKSKCGTIRYFLVVDDQPVFRDNEEELAEEYPDLCYVENDVTGETVYVPPMTFCFIGGTIFDNPALIKSNPKYLSNLKAQTKVNRERLLDGNWYARPEGSNYVTRGMVKKAEVIPHDAKCVRAWDKAASEPSDINRYPDYTACIGMAKDTKGDYYLFGNFHDDNHDDKSDVYGKFRKIIGKRDALIRKQAEFDGSDMEVILPQDPGAAGVAEFTESAKALSAAGIVAKADPMPSNKSKLTKFSPFASACENGMMFIVESTFENKATLDGFWKEVESFDGERSTGTKKDDWPDCAATAFNYLAKKKVLVPFVLPKINSPTKYASMKQ